MDRSTFLIAVFCLIDNWLSGQRASHHTRLAREAAESVGVTVLPLPFAPALMPCEDIWCAMKQTVAANRAYADVDSLAKQRRAGKTTAHPMRYPTSPGYSRPRSIGCLLVNHVSYLTFLCIANSLFLLNAYRSCCWILWGRKGYVFRDGTMIHLCPDESGADTSQHRDRGE